MHTLALPAGVLELMARLTDAGHHVYVVGGSVRDALRGLTPHDYDMTTDATPQEMQQIFSDYRVIETGIKHGTLTVLCDSVPYEITTYRVDGDYRDHRHPDEVSFTRSLKEDLARRDFTMNAIAYHPDEGVEDPFGGAEDITLRTIRAVGDPAERFREDALRILRALRFSATLGYQISPETAEAAFTTRDLLTCVSAERVRDELCKLLVGVNAPEVLAHYHDILAVRLPQMKSPSDRVLKAVATLPPDPLLRLVAVMLSAMADHPDEMDALMRELRFDNVSRARATRLIRHVAIGIYPEKHEVLRLLSVLWTDGVDDVFHMRHAFAATHAEKTIINQIRDYAHTLAESGACYRISDLAISGSEILAKTDIRGPGVGEALAALLDAVMCDRVENRPDALLAYLSSLPM